MNIYQVTILRKASRTVLNVIAESAGKATTTALNMIQCHNVPSAVICKPCGVLA